MSDIALSAGVRSNLNTMQGISKMLTQTQERLATGKKVNSALDNPRNFFTARGMSDRANTLTGLQDLMSTAQQTVKAANEALESMTKFLQAARSLAEQAEGQSGVDGRGMTSTNAVTSGAGPTPEARALSAVLTDNGLTAGQEVTFSAVVDGVTSSFTHTVGVGETVADLRDAVNASGVATMSVLANGQIEFNASGADTFSVAVNADVTANFLGFTAGPGAGQLTEAGGVTTLSSGVVTVESGIDYTGQVQELIQQFDNAARDAGVNGKNLLAQGANNALTVRFNEDGSSSLTIGNQDMTTNNFGGLITSSLTQATAGGFITAVDEALTAIKSFQTRLGNDQIILDERSRFTDRLVNVLQEGADNLTLADMNKEAANNLALQTRQQLGQTSLGLSNQADQAVLQLLR